MRSPVKLQRHRRRSYGLVRKCKQDDKWKSILFLNAKKKYFFNIGNYNEIRYNETIFGHPKILLKIRFHCNYWVNWITLCSCKLWWSKLILIMPQFLANQFYFWLNNHRFYHHRWPVLINDNLFGTHTFGHNWIRSSCIAKSIARWHSAETSSNYRILSIQILTILYHNLVWRQIPENHVQSYTSFERTNNRVEGDNNKMKQFCGAANPHIDI